MSFKSALIHNVFMLRWCEHEAGDSARVVEAVGRAKAQYGAPIVYVAIAPNDVPPPTENLRTEMAEALDRLLVHCCCVHLVIEASGFRGVVVRAAATGMFMVSGKRGRVSPHASVEDALSSCEHLAAPKSVILKSAMNQGLLVGGPAMRSVV